MVEYAITFLMSFWVIAMYAAKMAVKTPTIMTTVIDASLWMNSG